MLRRSVILLFTATMIVTGAHAADLDENYGYADQMPAPPVIGQSKVEFGSGWYVRGDIGATRLPNLSLQTTASQAPTVTLGNGSQYGYDASLGAGYEVNRWFRGDVVADFHKPIAVRSYGTQYPSSVSPLYGYANTAGTCQIGYVEPASTFYPAYTNCHSQFEGRIQSFNVLANGYINLGQYGIASPYIGAGAGLSFGHYSSSVAYYYDDGTHYDTTFTLPGSSVSVHGYRDVRNAGNYYNFAYALMGGLNLDVYEHTKLDIGYRYLNLGQVLGATLQYHEVRAGLRYMIDN